MSSDVNTRIAPMAVSPSSPPARLGAWLTTTPARMRWVLVLGFLLLWEVYARGFGNPLFLPPFTEVILAMPRFFTLPGVAESLWVTVQELGVAFAGAVVVGTTLGMLLGYHRWANQAFMPIALLIYATPSAIFLPLYMMVFGIGISLKTFYGFSIGVFPVLITVAAGVQNLRPILISSSRSMGASELQIFRHVVFPHMLPNFFTAMRLGMGSALLGVILSELYISTNGVGGFAKQFSMNFQTVNLYCLILVVTSMAILVNELLRRQEMRLSRWGT